MDIRFRGKLKEKYFNDYYDKGDVGDWIYSETIIFNGDKVYIGLPHIVYDKSFPVWEQIGETLAFHEIIPETLGQYAGLPDKNGKEIYKGDIVLDHNGKGIVEYIDDCCAFRINYKNGQAKWFIDYLKSEKEFEIIGIIYENPELLGDSDA